MAVNHEDNSKKCSRVRQQEIETKTQKWTFVVETLQGRSRGATLILMTALALAVKGKNKASTW